MVSQLDKAKASSLVNDGRGFSNRSKNSIYADRSVEQLFESLTSWSPVVRQRAAEALATRDGEFSDGLIELLQTDHLHGQLGACQTIAVLGHKANTTVPQLQELLAADDLWLRVKAADALAAIGDKARVAIPDLLKLLCELNPDNDPRAMQQRFLCFALFDQREGLLKKSLEGVDRDALYEAVQAGLLNEDGRARGAISSVYRNLSFEEIEPLLPAIHRAVAESAPSGMMFADTIRLNGLDLMSQLHIDQGMQLSIDLLELDRWGQGKRIARCLAALQRYGSAARDFVPQLEPLKQHFAKKRRLSDKDKKDLKLLEQTIQIISADSAPPKLRSLPQ